MLFMYERFIKEILSTLKRTMIEAYIVSYRGFGFDDI